MRDIRADLEERAACLEKQISAAEVQFDKLVERFKAEHESRLKHAKGGVRRRTHPIRAGRIGGSAMGHPRRSQGGGCSRRNRSSSR